MAFSFDNILSGARDIFDKASEKAGEAIDYSKNQIDRTQQRSKLKEKFSELGKAYYETQVNGADMADEMTKLMEEIKEINHRINELETGEKACPECGAMNDVNGTYCTTCGGKL